MAYNPNNPNGQTTSANSAPVVIASNQSAVPNYLTNSTGTANQVSPYAQIRIAEDTISNFYDAFDSGTVDVTNKWTSLGTVPTITNGTLSVNAGTTSLAFSALQSQPSFPLYGNMYVHSICVLKMDAVKTGVYRFFGLGLAQGSPTVSAPILDGAGFEWSDIDGLLYGVVWSGGTRTLNVALSSVQPVDLAFHRYAVYYKTSRVYFELDGVSVGSIAYPNPNISVMPQLNLVVNGASTVSPAATYQSSFNGVGDTAGNGRMLSDGSFPWRKATVTSGGALSVTSAGDTDTVITGASAQTATVNNILSTASGATATSTIGFRSMSVQVISTGTAGTFIFEGSNDNVNFQTIPVYNQILLTGVSIAAAITATAANLIYIFPITTEFVRLRIATTITGGSIQAFSRMSPSTWINPTTSVNINAGTVTTVSTVTAVSSVTSSNTSIPGIIADVASAALTTTTTTATLTPTFGSSYQVNIPVTVVSGTTPTLDVQIQESRDTGTNWVAIYDFPRITATGSYNSPAMPFTGNRIRYVQTVSGTTPSFTRAINRLQSSMNVGAIRQIVDRTLNPNTLNSTTASLNAESQTNNIMVAFDLAAVTVAPILQIQGSDDLGGTWYNIGSTLTGVANSTVSLTVASVTSQQFRALVQTAGTASTLNYVLLRAF